MKFSSLLLYNLARATTVTQVNGDEAEIQVPTILNPVAVLPRELRGHAAIAATEVQRQSFDAGIRRALAASGAQTDDTLATLGQGLWMIEIFLGHMADFNQALDGTDRGAQLFLRDPDALDSALIELFSAANVPGYVVRRFSLLLTRDSWSFVMRSSATGVGQTRVANSRVMASLLI